MKENLLKHKTIFIVAAAILLAALGFAAGMMVKTALADDSGSHISAERAKTIALESVGVSPQKATFTEVQMDTEGTKSIYEVDFYTSSNEYDFKIDAETGGIIEKLSEPIPSAVSPSNAAQTPQTPSNMQTPEVQQTQTPQVSLPSASDSASDYIGVDRAKSIALKHAGLSANKVTFTKTKLDSDDGTKTYEVEFITRHKEYEYEINAYTGKIMDVSIEGMNAADNCGYDD